MTNRNGKDGGEMITLQQAAEYAGVPYRTVHYAAQKEYLDCHRYGHLRLTTRQAVDRWLASPKKRRSRTP